MRPKLQEYAYLAITNFIKQKVVESGGNGVVIGLSGGIDSAVVSKLCADAIGPNRVLNVFMPTSVSSESDKDDVEEFCRKYEMELKIVDITPVVEAFKGMLQESHRKDLMGNIMTRCRMIILFHEANLRKRVVMGTSNKSELLIGYFTKFGDGGSDFCPIGDLYKTQVRELAQQIGIPESIIKKVPTAGLWHGQTDEAEIGVSYEDLDAILYGFEMNMTNEEIALKTGLPMNVIERVWKMHMATVHKRKMPLIPKISIRTLGIDWRG
ncbi:MAG: NAD+ synthase [Rectinema sp.]|nr:NAD+ synthase [Rectinema sp.]